MTKIFYLLRKDKKLMFPSKIIKERHKNQVFLYIIQKSSDSHIKLVYTQFIFLFFNHIENGQCCLTFSGGKGYSLKDFS